MKTKNKNSKDETKIIIIRSGNSDDDSKIWDPKLQDGKYQIEKNKTRKMKTNNEITRWTNNIMGLFYYWEPPISPGNLQLVLGISN